ncbi:DNA repair ATPase RecN [Pseudomonas sp. BS3782 TE3695]|uniref:hypothetical protein n=1 Tax=Pseudomonas sp. BS3782 TE3695 TaxID=3349323 RepID=UPI003D240D41
MFIESVVVSGPNLPDASVFFSKGANVVQGGSDTGKSYIVQCIKFVLGSKNPPKPIALSKDYTTVTVKFVNDDGSCFTIERPLEAEAKVTLTDEKGKISILGVKHNPKNSSTLSNQFLNRIGLDKKTLLLGAESLRSSAFSLRDLEKIFVIDESRIVAEYSPLGTGQYLERTKEKSILKLLLTGSDDAAVKGAKKDLASKDTLKHKVSAVEDIIAKFYPGDDAVQLTQLQKLNAFRHEVADALEVAEAELAAGFESNNDRFNEKTDLITDLAEVEERLSEDKSLLLRFGMLGEKYESDRQRLLGIEQAATLLDAVVAVPCPTCGNHFGSDSCESNIENVQQGVAFELTRIAENLNELSEAKNSLSISIERNTASSLSIKTSIAVLEKKIASGLQGFVQSVSDLKELLACVQSDLTTLDQQVQAKSKLSDELKRLGVLLLEEQSEFTAESFMEAAKPLIEEIQSILKRWGYPNYLPVEFDMVARDIVIGGSARGNFGKGYRAIAFSAFVLGLMNLLRLSGRHPGFVVLDSPLTTYKEGDDTPEDDRDEVAGDLIYAFYRDIADNFTGCQVIIFENKEPDMSIIPSLNYQHFTKSRSHGRYGFFPLRG